MVFPPKLPFLGYKWQWASLQCTEGINSPPVFLGVLRAARQCEGMSTSSPEFFSALKEIEVDTHTDVHLARTKDRNIIRNSGQYWKGFGLMQKTPGKIALTEFGKQLADGETTPFEFANYVVANHTLPNPLVQRPDVVRQWNKAGLKIRPLRVILDVVAALRDTSGDDEAHININELCKVVIPLSGTVAFSSKQCAQVILDYRRGNASLDGWPNCVPEANDRRIAKEFLLFLDHYGFLAKEANKRGEEQYRLAITRPFAKMSIHTDAENFIAIDELASTVVRNRVLRAQIERPGQAWFRSEVLNRSKGKCLLTGANMPEVLQAAHIKPVAYMGPDKPSNGLCLRADIHILFDSGHLRIDETGKIVRSRSASGSYSFLPARVALPRYVNMDMIKWRHRYL